MKKRSKIDPTKISGDAVIPIDGGKGKSAKPRMLNGMVKRDLVAEWNAPIHRANVRPWNPFKDDSAKFKGRPEQWIYTRPGKITFVAVSFFLMGLFAWFFIPHAHHHGMRIYQENEVLIHSNIDPYADSLGQHPYVEDLISWVDSGASKAQKKCKGLLCGAATAHQGCCCDLQIALVLLKIGHSRHSRGLRGRLGARPFRDVLRLDWPTFRIDGDVA